MADIRQVFSTLEGASGEGQALRQVVQGDTPTAKNGLLAYAFRDSAGNIILPQLTSDGRLPVTQDLAGTPKNARGEILDGAASGSFVTVAEVDVTADAIVTNIAGSVTCRQDSYFQLVQDNNGSLSVLEDIILSAGQYSIGLNQGKKEVVAGSTGTQRLLLRAYNLKSPLSALRGQFSFIEAIS